MFKVYSVSDDYIEYCRKIDYRVHNNHKDGEKFVKKYLGIVFEMNNTKYYVPFSSYKPEKHDKMRESIDFIKIEEPGNKYAVLNLNNMIPVPNEVIIEFDMDYSETHTEEEMKYRDLLWAEWEICKAKQNKILTNAKLLYQIVIDKKPEHIVRRCCDFPLLERASIEYITRREVAAGVTK